MSQRVPVQNAFWRRAGWLALFVGIVVVATAAVDHVVFDGPLSVKSLILNPVFFLTISVLNLWGIPLAAALIGLLLALARGGWPAYFAALGIFLVQAVLVLGVERYSMPCGPSQFVLFAIVLACSAAVYGFAGAALAVLARHSRSSMRAS